MRRTTLAHSRTIYRGINKAHLPKCCYWVEKLPCEETQCLNSELPALQRAFSWGSEKPESSKASTSNSKRSPCIWTSLLGATAILGAATSSTTLNEASESGDSENEGLQADSSSKNIIDTEKVMEHAKRGIEERLKSANFCTTSFPPFEVATKGQQVAIRFPVSPVCDIWRIIVDLVARMGDSSHGVTGKKIYVSSLKSAVALLLTMEYPQQTGPAETLQEDTKREPDNTLCVWVFEPLIGEKFPEVEFLKKGYFSSKELDMVVSTLYIASGVIEDSALSRYRKEQVDKANERSSNGSREKKEPARSTKSIVEPLETMGVKVYGLETDKGNNEISWDNIAGYHEQKREIEDSVLLALRRPDIYDSIARGTRRKFESNRPRALLFEGPPGTGKTSCARVIANQSGIPLLYVPVEVILSKYYGESEKLLRKIFDTANKFPDGAIIFLDEIDSLATIRDSEMHEATRRLLSVLLRQIDGFEQDARVVIIAATNRKDDLDPALISRFDISVTFGLPDKHTREEIIVQYARHLSSSEVASLAAVTEGMSGRDLRDICEHAERHWASKLIREMIDHSTTGLPPIREYMDCAAKRRESSSHVWPGKQWNADQPARGSKKGRPSSSVLL